MVIRDDGAPESGSGRTQGSDDLRRLLLDAAMDLLREPDTPLDLRKVAERAGKSRTAPYLVFGKESEGGGVLALRIAVAAEGARIMSRMMIEASGHAEDPLAAFHRVAEAFLEFVERYPRLFRLMYGPEMNAISRLGEEGFRAHPEFQQLLEYRDIAGQVITDLIEDAQRRGLLPSDPWPSETSGASEALDEAPSIRYLQIAWATMIGVAVLRDDDLLKAIGWNISRKQGARVVAESVLGLDPGSVGSAARTFLSSSGVDSIDDPWTGVAQSAINPMDAGPADIEETGVGPAGTGDMGMGQPRPETSPGAIPPDSTPTRLSPSASAGHVEEPPPPLGIDAPDMRSMRVSLSSALGPSSAASKFSQVFRTLRGRGKDAGGESLGAYDAGDKSVRAEDASDQSVRDEEDVTLTTVLGSYPGLRRAAYSRKQIGSARILWIDDHPEGIASEVETIEHLGAHITVVRSTEDAVALLGSPEELAWSGRRIIISDIARDGVPDAGTRAIPLLLAAAPVTAILFYIADLDPRRGIPEGAQGITTNTDELLHLLMDALEGR